MRGESILYSFAPLKFPCIGTNYLVSERDGAAVLISTWLSCDCLLLLQWTYSSDKNLVDGATNYSVVYMLCYEHYERMNV